MPLSSRLPPRMWVPPSQALWLQIYRLKFRERSVTPCSSSRWFRALDANSWKNNLLGLKKSVNTQNDFGGTVGGPVYIPHLYDGRNKTFFFFDYEGFRFHTGGTNTLSLPPEAFRSGDFSALCQSG